MIGNLQFENFDMLGKAASTEICWAFQHFETLNLWNFETLLRIFETFGTLESSDLETLN